MSAASTGTPAGRPSRMETRDCPCDSPAVVKRNGLRRSSLDVRGRQIDDDEPALREREQLEDDARIVARHRLARAQWTVNRILELERPTIDEVRDVEDFDRAGGRGDERRPLDGTCRVVRRH